MDNKNDIMKSISKLFNNRRHSLKSKTELLKINEGFVVEFDIKVGNNAYNHVVKLPEGYKPTRRDAERYIHKYLAVINNCLTVGDTKRVFAGIIQIYRMNITAKFEEVTISLNLNKL